MTGGDKMTINSHITDGNNSIEVITEIEQDCISISCSNTAAGVNIFFNGDNIVAYIYPQDATGPEIITLSTK